jgi:hypothetical protein
VLVGDKAKLVMVRHLADARNHNQLCREFPDEFGADGIAV